jgi:hypothetical protein
VTTTSSVLRPSGRGRLGGSSRLLRAGAARRSVLPAARMSASDHATIKSHRTTASQTITERKVVPFGLVCHRTTVGFAHDTTFALECGRTIVPFAATYQGDGRCCTGSAIRVVRAHIRARPDALPFVPVDPPRQCEPKGAVMGWRH